MILGKHDHIVGWTAQLSANRAPATLVTPVVSFVPEGDYVPPTGHMRFPGTIGVPEKVFAGTLEGIARSLMAGGFKVICLIADHGASIAPQNEVAERLNKEWARDGIKVISVDDYYNAAGDAQSRLLASQGETPATIGQHAGITDTSELMAVHPGGVDLSRFSALPFSLAATGVDGDPRRASVERGKAARSQGASRCAPDQVRVAGNVIDHDTDRLSRPRRADILTLEFRSRMGANDGVAIARAHQKGGSRGGRGRRVCVRRWRRSSRAGPDRRHSGNLSGGGQGVHQLERVGQRGPGHMHEIGDRCAAADDQELVDLPGIIDRAGCIQTKVYLPSYIEWLTCFEMNKVVRK